MLIHNWALTEEERNVTRTRVEALLITYRKGRMDRNEVNRYFSEWTEIATRLNKGAKVLDNNKAVQERSKQHMRELEDLYTLLLKLLGMYDEFFKRMYHEQPHYHVRAQRKIMDILQDRVA